MNRRPANQQLTRNFVQPAKKTTRVGLKKPASRWAFYPARLSCAFLLRCAGRQLEVGDARIPGDLSIDLIRFEVLILIPESTAVRGIHGHAADVTPVR